MPDLSREDILGILNKDIQKLKKRLEAAINFGWEIKKEIIVCELNYLKAIRKKLIQRKVGRGNEKL